MAKGSFDWDDGHIGENMATLDSKVHAGITAAAMFAGEGGEAFMKANARWTDRTGAARSGLTHDVRVEVARWTIVLAHSVSYGIWLETREDFNGRYAIINPGVLFAAEQFKRAVDGMYRKV